MTDEEKAEEYTRNCKYVEADYFVNKIAKVKAIYLDGLAEGKLKWHKVADGDLPEHRYYVLVSRGTRTDKALYNKYEEKWYSYYDGDELDNVTAWCEIPKYEE